MTETLFQSPNLARVQNSGEWGILPETLTVLVLGSQDRADFLQRMMKKFSPFRIATEQCGRVEIQTCPAVKVLAGELQQVRLLPQPHGSATAQFETDLVYQLVTHACKLAG
jgi:hypothetical protein